MLSQLNRGQAQQRMTPLGGDFSQWPHHEEPLVSSGVGQNQTGRGAGLATHGDKVKIEGPWGVWDRARPPKCAFDGK